MKVLRFIRVDCRCCFFFSCSFRCVCVCKETTYQQQCTRILWSNENATTPTDCLNEAQHFSSFTALLLSQRPPGNNRIVSASGHFTSSRSCSVSLPTLQSSRTSPLSTHPSPSQSTVLNPCPTPLCSFPVHIPLRCPHLQLYVSPTHPSCVCLSSSAVCSVSCLRHITREFLLAHPAEKREAFVVGA